MMFNITSRIFSIWFNIISLLNAFILNSWDNLNKKLMIIYILLSIHFMILIYNNVHLVCLECFNINRLSFQSLIWEKIIIDDIKYCFKKWSIKHKA
jgi:RsiW-degrading membrane proteinase PrsW (M82 family)